MRRKERAFIQYYSTIATPFHIFQFLKELNLTYQKLTGFVILLYFIPIVLVP
jgi:hypothetical protein